MKMQIYYYNVEEQQQHTAFSDDEAKAKAKKNSSVCVHVLPIKCFVCVYVCLLKMKL